jgi:anti-anti-sigma regulatory factor
MATITQKSIEIDVVTCDGGSEFILKGEINEDLLIEDLITHKSELIKINFEDVEMINSCGVREWIKFVEAVSNTGSKVQYFNCPQIVVQQVNMVTGFVPNNGTVETFYAPYFCDECENEDKALLKSGELTGRTAPEITCTKCGEVSEIDAMEDIYLNFIPE